VKSKARGKGTARGGALRADFFWAQRFGAGLGCNAPAALIGTLGRRGAKANALRPEPHPFTKQKDAAAVKATAPGKIVSG
jgi:hypothetical protein